jgi:hypothetical protein
LQVCILFRPLTCFGQSLIIRVMVWLSILIKPCTPLSSCKNRIRPGTPLTLESTTFHHKMATKRSRSSSCSKHSLGFMRWAGKFQIDCHFSFSRRSSIQLIRRVPILIDFWQSRSQANQFFSFIYSWSSGPENRRKKHQQIRYQIIRESFEILFLVLRKLEALQWEVFIQKVDKNLFCSYFYFLGPKKCFLWFWETPDNFLGQIRPGQFVGQNSGYNAPITSREKLFKFKTVYDSDLQSLPVVSMVFGDILMMYLTLFIRPPPLLHSQSD